MKTHLRAASVILIVSVALAVNGASPATNSATAITDTASAALVPPPVSGAINNPGHVVGQMPPEAAGGLLNANDFLQPLTPGSARVNGIRAGNPDFSPTGMVHNSAPIAPDEGSAPPRGWQRLPFDTDVPSAGKPLQSNAPPNQVRRSFQERDTARIEQLVREGALEPARQSERQFDGQINPARSFQPYVSFSGDQINILNTFLRD